MKTRKIQLNGAVFTLGKKYRDTLLGNEGIGTAGTSYLTGCDQLLLEYVDSTGRPVSGWIDVTRIEAVEGKKVQVPDKPGGPAPNIPSRAPTTCGLDRM